MAAVAALQEDAAASAPVEEVDLPAALPQFLRQSKFEIQNRFVDLEWQQRNRLLAGTTAQTSQWARLSGEEIAIRNRYLDVQPFAGNRVKLQVKEGVNDYINASPIELGNRRYIATQGPKSTSTSHFYRMLGDETGDVAVVVMLTQTHEAGREKCFPYFPDSVDAPLQLGPDPEVDDWFEGTVTLVDIDEDAKARTTVRKLLLRMKTEDGTWVEKEVFHCLFGGWPDFSIPEGENRNAMLELIALSARLNGATGAPQSSSFKVLEDDDRESCASEATPAVDSESQPEPSLNPRVVHCSAGVGRSGTFIALDYLFGQLRVGALDQVADDKDPIAETVDKLRQQRMMMVQGESQFLFLYEVLKDAWLQRWTAMQNRSNAQSGTTNETSDENMIE